MFVRLGCYFNLNLNLSPYPLGPHLSVPLGLSSKSGEWNSLV